MFICKKRKISHSSFPFKGDLFKFSSTRLMSAKLCARFNYSFLSTISWNLRLQYVASLSEEHITRFLCAFSTMTRWNFLYKTKNLHYNLRLSGLSPFSGSDDYETMTNVSFAKYSFDFAPFDEISSTAKDFVEKLLVKESSKRMSAKNALKHEWLQNLDCKTENSDNEAPLSLTKTKLKRYVILRR
jgi:serine/threonine protein kinase